MLASELIAILETRPDIPVEVFTETLVTPLVNAEVDKFNDEEGFVWVLLPDLSEADL